MKLKPRNRPNMQHNIHNEIDREVVFTLAYQDDARNFAGRRLERSYAHRFGEPWAVEAWDD